MFKRKPTAESVTEGLDLTGKTIVITGINSGLGYETMRVLARRGAHVIGLARTMQKATDACTSVAGRTTPLACELSDMASVKRCAEEIVGTGLSIDCLICNAGILALPDLQVKDGLELQFLTNHMGHFLLTYLLQGKIKSAREGRIVMVSSAGHKWTVTGGIDFENLDGSHGYDPWKFYGQSKLAGLLTALAFNERLENDGVTANAVHPGGIATDITRNVNGILGFLVKSPLKKLVSGRFFVKTIEQGAATQCYVAVHPDLKGKGGLYFANNRVAKTSRYGRDRELAIRLWDYSVAYLRDYLGDGARE